MLAVCSLLIAALVLTPTSTVGKTPDSYSYIKAATNLAEGSSIGTDYRSWPPLYPMALAPFIALHLESHLDVLNYLLLAASALASMIMFRSFGSGLILAMALTVVVAHSSPMQLIFRMAWSETLFIPLSLAWLISWSQYLTAGKTSDLIFACLFHALCLATRHAGIPITATMLATILLRARLHSLAHLARTIAAIALSTVPYLIWLWRTYLISGTTTGERLPQPQPFWMLLSGFSATLSHWLLPGTYLHGINPAAIAASLAALAILCFSVVHFLRIPLSEPKERNFGVALGLTSSVFVLGYAAFVLWATHRTFLDVPGDRYLAPIYVPLLGLAIFGIKKAAAWLEPNHRYLWSALFGATWLWIVAEAILP